MGKKGKTKVTGPPWWMLRNSAGERDGMWTLVVVAFATTTASYILSAIEVVNFGGFTLEVREFEGAGYASTVLIPLIAAYFGRRWTKAQASRRPAGEGGGDDARG